MPRPFTREGLETRVAIRKAFEANPAMSHADLRRQFGAVQQMVDSAMGKTAAEWQAMATTEQARTAYQPRKTIPLGNQIVQKKSSTSQALNATRHEVLCWEYRTIVVRGRLVLNDVVYEQQGKDYSDWKPLNAKTFGDALNLFGKDGWQLTGMLLLSHGAVAFTGLYELVFKRSLEHGITRHG